MSMVTQTIKELSSSKEPEYLIKHNNNSTPKILSWAISTQYPPLHKHLPRWVTYKKKHVTKIQNLSTDQNISSALSFYSGQTSLDKEKSCMLQVATCSVL